VAPEEPAASGQDNDHLPQERYDEMLQGVGLTREQVLLIQSCNDLMIMRLDRLHEQRRELCWQLEHLAAVGRRAAGLGGPQQAARAAGPPLPPPSPCDSASTTFGWNPTSGGVTTATSGQRSKQEAYHPPVQQEEQQGADDAEPPPGAHLDAFAAQADVVEELSANTERMGAIIHLHQLLVYCVFTDAQRARLRAAAYPVAWNAGRCLIALQHLMRLRPEVFASAETVDLRSQQAVFVNVAMNSS